MENLDTAIIMIKIPQIHILLIRTTKSRGHFTHIHITKIFNIANLYTFCEFPIVAAKYRFTVYKI